MSIVQLCADKDQHCLSIVDKLRKMRSEKTLCDFVIRVGSEEIHAHRHVLCVGSDFFDDLLSTDSEENRSGVLELPDSDAKCVVVCIDYIYGEIFVIPDGKHEEMMRLAKLMKLDEIYETIIDLLRRNLNLENFCAAKAVTKLHECKDLEEKCDKFAEENFTAIARRDDFRKLDKNFIKEMIRLRKVKIPERDKLDALLKWISYDSERAEDALGMLKLVDLKQIPLQYRQHLIEEESAINTNQECLLHFSLSLLDTMDITLFDQNSEKPEKHESRVVIFDGITCHLQQFNPTNGTLVQKHEFGAGIKGASTVVTLHDDLYVLRSKKVMYRLKFVYDNATWDRMSDMPHDHGFDPPAVVIAERIFVVGGSLGGGTATVDVFDVELDKWVHLACRPVSSLSSGTLASGGLIYCFGGYLDGSISNKVAIFDTKAVTWNDAPPMKDAKAYVSPVELDGKIYVVGGDNGSKSTRSVECYDITTKTWTIVKRLKRPRFGPRVMVIEGIIYAFGGANTDNMLEKYDPEKNEWNTENLRVENLSIHAAVKINLPC